MVPVAGILTRTALLTSGLTASKALFDP